MEGTLNTEIFKRIERCKDLLIENTEWIERYAGYADALLKVREEYKEKREKFHVPKPLCVYSTISKAKGGGGYSLRYKGEEVGTLVWKGDKLCLSSKLKSNFKWNRELEDTEWEDARDFRQHFINLENGNPHSPEHYIENQILLEFKKSGRAKSKLLCYIQPVELLGCFFQMPTPLAASDLGKGVDYTGAKGGGIDILARVTHAPSKSHICVCELKDENKQGEPQDKVVLQATAYATFIGMLLHSDKGQSEKWWKLFGFSKRPAGAEENIDIDVVTIMPRKDKNGCLVEDCLANQEFQKFELYKGKYVTLHFYSLFFERNDKGEITEFLGTLKDAIDPICK